MLMTKKISYPNPLPPLVGQPPHHHQAVAGQKTLQLVVGECRFRTPLALNFASSTLRNVVWKCGNASRWLLPLFCWRNCCLILNECTFGEHFSKIKKKRKEDKTSVKDETKLLIPKKWWFKSRTWASVWPILLLFLVSQNVEFKFECYFLRCVPLRSCLRLVHWIWTIYLLNKPFGQLQRYCVSIDAVIHC